MDAGSNFCCLFLSASNFNVQNGAHESYSKLAAYLRGDLAAARAKG
jgi:hypothetical protein